MFLKIQLPCSHIVIIEPWSLMKSYKPGSDTITAYCDECNHTQSVRINSKTIHLIKQQVEEENHLNQLRNSIEKLLEEVENCVSRKIRLEITLSKTIVGEL